MKIKILTILILFSSVLHAAVNDKKQGSLVLNFSGLKSDQGFVVVKLYDQNSPKFPDTKSAISIMKAPVSEGKTSILFPDLPYGTYAFTTFHDENNNGVMDTNFLHFPIEGYAFSNKRKVVFGPPSFARASFKIDRETVIVDVKMNY
ncbi:MAG TPA: DUF2141 domain-containing protein [Prolixibacteraceae bacterium]|nr:DUF2141 domain-containing protein [Prolixibacteraceae bacterium]